MTDNVDLTKEPVYMVWENEWTFTIFASKSEAIKQRKISDIKNPEKAPHKILVFKFDSFLEQEE